jgi:hypothetical protein
MGGFDDDREVVPVGLKRPVAMSSDVGEACAWMAMASEEIRVKSQRHERLFLSSRRISWYHNLSTYSNPYFM